jgi:hypothetical protein
VTFGAYGVYWYWQVNEDLRARGVPVRPALSALAVSWGVFLFLPPLISCFNTAQRVRSLKGEQRPGEAMTILSMLFLFYPAYLQFHLNRLPSRAAEAAPDETGDQHDPARRS